ncbi:hypothetical protein C4578_01460 [Candidatus Microgenomates bacterium]|jgi:TM2 domain-containing membrane protein YozV|nr:MAG: hypothetical protein C4578_01460 [Candidatus Microgenomates bacterium]
MNKGINLISLEARKIAKEQKVKGKVKSASFVFVGVFIVMACLVIGFVIILNQKFKNNGKKITALENQIKALEKNESYLVTIADRVRHVNSILESRKAYANSMQDLEKIYVEDLNITGLDFGAKGDMKIEGRCAGVACLTELNNKVEEIKAENKYKEIVFETVNRTVDGRYFINLDFKK